MKKIIPFNKPFISNKSKIYMKKAYDSGNHCGNKYWTEKVINLVRKQYDFGETFLVPSCTAALEMGVMLVGIKPGDEVIIPSYTFSSTANSVLIFGGIPVFCDINPSTLNIDPDKIEKLITKKTKLIIPIDYAGVPCEINKIKKIAKKYSIPVMVDAAQSFGSKINSNDWSGSQADLVAFSFHETKNLSCGEGGALVVNNKRFLKRAYLIQEKGTDRKKVILGIKNKYSWVDYGSSYILSDILAAVLYGQIEDQKYIIKSRSNITNCYKNISKKYDKFLNSINQKYLKSYNHHAYFFLFKKEKEKINFINYLKRDYSISAYIGYSPLHSSRMGRKLGYKKNDLPITEKCAKLIVRLPVFTELGNNLEDLDYVTQAIETTLNKIFNL
tara:strand:+ start:141 stop:1298 length:1158 start_codon:yes stop_codon:yes gene_type:complete